MENQITSFLATVERVFGTSSPLEDGDIKDNVAIYNNNDKFAAKDARTYGAITYLYENEIIDEDYAYPFDKNNFTFPIKGETVIILKMFGKYQQTFWMPYTNSPYPGYRRDYITFERTAKRDIELPSKDSSGGDMKNTAAAGGQTKTAGDKKDDKKYKINEKIKLLQPRTGDTIISGRAGNTIRFSEFLFTEDAIVNADGTIADGTSSPGIYIRNKQNPELDSKPIGELVEEDINKDGTSIYITSNKTKTTFKETVTKKKVAFTEYPNSKDLKGDQLFVNSDRIILSSKAKEFIIFGKGNTGVITDGRYTIDSAKDFYVHTDSNAIIHSNKSIILNSDANGVVYLGKAGKPGKAGATVQQMVLGGELIKILGEILDECAKIIVPTPVGPSGAPINAAVFKAIKGKLGVIQSARNYLTK
jgi:hypothetical protein